MNSTACGKMDIKGSGDQRSGSNVATSAGTNKGGGSEGQNYKVKRRAGQLSSATSNAMGDWEGRIGLWYDKGIAPIFVKLARRNAAQHDGGSAMSNQVPGDAAGAQKTIRCSDAQHCGTCAEQIEGFVRLLTRAKAARDYFAWEQNKILRGDMKFNDQETGIQAIVAQRLSKKRFSKDSSTLRRTLRRRNHFKAELEKALKAVGLWERHNGRGCDRKSTSPSV